MRHIMELTLGTNQSVTVEYETQGLQDHCWIDGQYIGRVYKDKTAGIWYARDNGFFHWHSAVTDLARQWQTQQAA